MNQQEYKKAIVRFLADKEGRRFKARALARRMGVTESDYGDFRAAYKALRDEGRLVHGSKTALTLPSGTPTMEGRFRANPKGFGFIVPEEPGALGDLFVPSDKTGGAMNGDLVVAQIKKQGQRGGQMKYAGEIIDVKERGLSKIVGTLEHTDGAWFVLPDGRRLATPVLVGDVPVEHRKTGTKVLTEIVRYPVADELPTGVIVEVLGQSGQPEAEIKSIVRAYNLPEEFPDAVIEDARAAARKLEPEKKTEREDLTSKIIITIDPVTARDYDDAISLDENTDGTFTLGVHIADVSHFVTEGGPLDTEARGRGTSVYFPRKVIPMLPEILSNGVCSLQEGQVRFTKSAFITYDTEAKVISTRLANTIIKSFARLTYEEAEDICKNKTTGHKKQTVNLVLKMEQLAKKIEARRKAAGMLHLELPEVDLVLDDEGRVLDASPVEDIYSHKIIEMFMVEANEAVATEFAKRKEKIIRRVHPDPAEDSMSQLATFVKACGFKISSTPSRKDLQELSAKAAGRPQSHAVNIAILRSMQKAVYSPEIKGHFALASVHYCHFTSPIRRYADLEVHRALDRILNDPASRPSKEHDTEVFESAKQLSVLSRRAEAAEHELRQVLILQHLQEHVGDTFEGVITGVAEFGMFIQSPRFLIEGLIRLQDLGDDWWDVSAALGKIRGQTTGKSFRIGDKLNVRIAKVDVQRRQLDLALAQKDQDLKKSQRHHKRKGRKKSK